jgi:hypothetical protein
VTAGLHDKEQGKRAPKKVHRRAGRAGSMTEPHPVLDVPQQFEPATSFQVRDELADYLARDLLGPWDGPAERLKPGARGPRDRYLVGALGPRFNPRSTLEAADRMPDELGADADTEDGELPEQFSVQNAGRLWASSMGLSFTVPACRRWR